MLQYKDVQQSHRHDSLSYMNPQHKKYDRLRDRILYLKYEADGIEMSDQFGVAPIPPADGLYALPLKLSNNCQVHKLYNKTLSLCYKLHNHNLNTTNMTFYAIL